MNESRKAKRWFLYTGGISIFEYLLLIENRVDVAQNLQGLSYEVYSTNITTIYHTWIMYSKLSLNEI